MDPALRQPFNAFYTESLFERYRDSLTKRLGNFPFRLAETPLFLSENLRAHLQTSALEIVSQLSVPSVLSRLKTAIPEHYDVPQMTALPDCVQVDFALVRGESGNVEGRVVELQAFPSLYALQTIEADTWGEILRNAPGLEGEWSCFFSEERAQGIDSIRRCILGEHDPSEVALVDFAPTSQKTFPDFVATKMLTGVDSVCVTDIEKEGRTLYRRVLGKRVPIRRIYNRLVFDELEVKNVKMPFSWRDELDVSWCSHPNWYWTWSKYSLPYVNHASVPKAQFLSEITEYPRDLENYVLKPLFSFAGSGVTIDVTQDVIDAVPFEKRSQYILQHKIEYAWVIPMPHHKAGEPLDSRNAVKAEVRMMLMRGGPNEPLKPLLPLVRLSRGRMLGVDQNRSTEISWTGGAAGIWLKSA